MEKKTWRRCGRSLRIILFIANGVVWIVALMALLGGIIIGFYTKSIIIEKWDLRDFLLSNPATIVIYYGGAIGLAASAGCFAGAGGRWWWTAMYCALLLTVALLDFFCGVHLFYDSQSLLKFLDSIQRSMRHYGESKLDKKFGIFPISVTEYWDHTQNQLHCCGWNNFKDWRNTTLGGHRHLPDTCCLERYAAPECGKELLRHPDNRMGMKQVEHLLTDIIHNKGCLEAYPDHFIEFFEEGSILGICLFAFLVFCFLLSLVLFLVVLTKRYKPGQNLHKLQKQEEPKPRVPARDPIGTRPEDIYNGTPIRENPWLSRDPAVVHRARLARAARENPDNWTPAKETGDRPRHLNPNPDYTIKKWNEKPTIVRRFSLPPNPNQFPEGPVKWDQMWYLSPPSRPLIEEAEEEDLNANTMGEEGLQEVAVTSPVQSQSEQDLTSGYNEQTHLLILEGVPTPSALTLSNEVRVIDSNMTEGEDEEDMKSVSEMAETRPESGVSMEGDREMDTIPRPAGTGNTVNPSTQTIFRNNPNQPKQDSLSAFSENAIVVMPHLASGFKKWPILPRRK